MNFIPPPLTFQTYISESNHIFTLAFEQSCFLSFLIQGNLTTDKEKAAQFNDFTKKQGSLYELNSRVIITDNGYIGEVIWSHKCFYGVHQILVQYSITCLSVFLWCFSVEGSCSTDLSGLNIIHLRQLAVDNSLPPDVYPLHEHTWSAQKCSNFMRHLFR